MNKQGSEFDLGDLVREVADRTEQTATDVKHVLSTAFDVIAEALAEEETHRVELHGVGVFRLRWRKDRTTTLNGTEYLVPGHHRIIFKAAPAFAELVSEITGEPAK